MEGDGNTGLSLGVTLMDMPADNMNVDNDDDTTMIKINNCT